MAIKKVDKEGHRLFYEERKMPCCGSTRAYKGPRGGLSMNIKCCGCGREFNIAPAIHLIEELI